ncbi:MAG TPA: hypothetical protein VKC59_07305, partial [Candidatus Limnocylindrales bacterium]|nr:hypothetical protein [Candidatus Limnocylindrales bacterium]
MQLVEGRPVYAATDLVAFLACSHLLALERAALAGLVERPVRNDPEIDIVAKRGLDHEQRYLEELRSQGLTILEIAKLPDTVPYAERLWGEAEATRAALASGVEVIYQATFFDGTWLGYADFLLKVDRPSNLGSWSYEVADTKLARRTKASAVLQICSYVEQLTRIQGI